MASASRHAIHEACDLRKASASDFASFAASFRVNAVSLVFALLRLRSMSALASVKSLGGSFAGLDGAALVASGENVMIAAMRKISFIVLGLDFLPLLLELKAFTLRVHRFTQGVLIRLTTKAQRPGARERSIATATLSPGSLQRMVSRLVTHHTQFQR